VIPRPTDGRITAWVALLLSVVLLAPVGARAEELEPRKATGYHTMDVPPRPERPAMTADEQLKLKNDLSAARDHQAPKGKSGAGAGQPSKP
jgi:hypothetical protein